MKRGLELRLAGAVVMAVLLLWCRPAQADGGWQLAGWGGTRMTSVTANPQHAQELAVVADGVLELSHDGGVVWLPSVLPAQVNAVAYDPVQAGWLYVGSNTGTYVSHDSGLSWQRFEAVQTTHKIVVAITVDNQYVFASMYDGAGTPVRVFRIGRDGIASDIGFPDGNANCFALDGSRHRLYVGSAAGVYSSDDEGVSWQGGGHGAGSFTNRVVVKPGEIWQLSADGLYRSHDDGQSWDRLAGPGDLNGTYYGSDMHVSGLAVSNGAAYYGAWNIGYPYKFLAVYAGGGARSIFDGRVNEVAAVGGRLWIATDNGLWVNDSLVGTEAAVRRPVVIVPGILGSLPTTEALKAYAAATVEEGYWNHTYKTPLELDPIDHTYDGLINYLLARGYQRDTTLFVFPYNWMQDNTVTARQLAQKLQDIRQTCGCTQVDVVAHSMGGLVARSYIQSDTYQGDIANLIELATPNAGAVEDYGVWESGEFGGITTPSRLLNLILQALGRPQTDSAKVTFLRQFMPSVGQLLPVFNYLATREYPVGYPGNPFLERLNQPADITRLKQRVALYVVGGNTKPTLQSLEVGLPRSDIPVWPDGRITASSLGVGDSTVLQSSLEAADKASLLLDADHGGVVSAAAPFVAQTLMGGYVDEPSSDPPSPVLPSHYLLIYASGTIALHVVATNGQTIDDSGIAIPGAYYSGSATAPQLMMIPDPGAGSYRITITGTGPYTVGAADTATTDVESDDAAPAAASDSVSGMITAGEAQQLTYDAGLQQLQADRPMSVAPYTPISLGTVFGRSERSSVAITPDDTLQTAVLPGTDTPSSPVTSWRPPRGFHRSFGALEGPSLLPWVVILLLILLVSLVLLC